MMLYTNIIKRQFFNKKFKRARNLSQLDKNTVAIKAILYRSKRIFAKMTR